MTDLPPENDLAVRGADPRDLEDLMGLLGDCVREMRARGLDQWDEIYPARSTLQTDLDDRALYVASTPTRALAGAFTLNQHQEPEYSAVAWQIAGAPIGVVHRLMVHPATQSAGVGRRLMRLAERQAHRLGFRVLRLDTLVANERALALYRGLGYREAGPVRFRKGLFACFEKLLESAG
jgi:ribosomal protein S18 acetylase RimI-like enzyme